MDIQIDNIRTLLDEARRPIVLTDLAAAPVAFIPDGFKAQDMEQYLPQPTRKRAAVTLTDTPSFIEYVAQHVEHGRTRIYAAADFEQQKIELTAIIDDHGIHTDGASWREHTATFRPTQTVEWKRWNAQDGKALPQLAFAEWLEDNMGDIATIEGLPTGTDMLAMAREFEANYDKRFRSKVNLQGGGVHLVFVDEANKETESRMQVFDRFALGIRPFLNGDAYRVDARLKYRQESGQLRFWFELIRPDQVFEQAVKTELAKIGDTTRLTILFGSPSI